MVEGKKKKDILNIFACWRVIWAIISELTFTAQTGHTYKEKYVNLQYLNTESKTNVPIVATLLTINKGPTVDLFSEAHW